jgi:basic membrane protein A and related proteins
VIAQPPRRRLLLAGASALALGACAKWRSQAPERGPVAAMFPGRIDDGGFIESGYRGLLRIRDELGIPVRHVEGIAPDEEAMKAALRALADSDATLVIAHGGQASGAVQRIAWEFPQQRFVSIQGHLTRPNLAVYEVLQDQSAWLAGAAAGLLTKSNVVGHMSGLRVRPGLDARAAFAGGLASTNARARLLTNFSGTQDDPAVAQRIALAQIDAGADLIFTMLNAGRTGAIEACRERGVKQIGNVRDWVTVMPDVFVASAVADAGVAVFQSGRDLSDNLWKGEVVKRFGVRYPDAVRLALAPTVPPAVRDRVDTLAKEMAAGAIAIPETYSGPEFMPA